MQYSFSYSALNEYFPKFRWLKRDNFLYGIFYFKDSDTTAIVRIDDTDKTNDMGMWFYSLYEISGDCSSEPLEELMEKAKHVTTMPGYFSELYIEDKKDLPLVVAICGTSGCGKTTLSKKLKERYNIPYIVSHTTRPMRKGESQGVEHWFDSDSELPDKENMLAYTYFGGNHYYALMSDIEGLKAVTYTIDEAGILDLIDMEKSGKIRVIWIQIQRPDNPTDEKRVERDRDREEAQKKLSDMGRWPDAWIFNNYSSVNEFLDIEAKQVSDYIKKLTDGISINDIMVI